MSEKTNEQALAELNAMDDLRDKLITCYPSITQRDADDAAEWAYEQIHAAVAAERETCCAVNAKLLEACEALVVRIDEWMALDMPCPLCDGYVPHFDDCPYTFAAAAIRVRTGEGEIDNPPVV